MKFVCSVGFLLIVISVALPCEGNEITDDSLVSQASKLIFGDLWRFDQFCGRNRTGKQLAQDDFLYQGFYNGSQLDSIKKLSDPEEIQIAISELIYVGLAARSSIPIICSINSWGYADDSSFHPSNADMFDSTGCLEGLDRLHNSIGTIQTETRDRDCSHNDVGGAEPRPVQGDQLLHDWLQLNTFGRINQGYPFSSHIWVGDYNACKKLPRTRYCFGALSSRRWNTDSNDFIRVGLCLPESCDSRSFSDSVESMRILSQIIERQNFGRETMQLKDVHCLPDDDSQIRNPIGDPLSVALIVLLLVWISLTSFATLFGSFKQLGRFNFLVNLNEFFQTRPDANGFTGLNFIKVLCMFWLVITHNLILTIPYLRNFEDMRATGNSSPLAVILLQGQHSVVVFFLISGFLFGYKLLASDKQQQPAIKMIMSRYLRLAPLYLVVYVYVKKFAHLMSSGPFWDYGVSAQSEIRQCMKESWLVPIFLLADFIPPFSHCILTGWHIANDFHIFLLLPALLKVYRISRGRGRLVVISSFAISHLFHVWNFHWQDNFNYESLTREPFTLGTRTLMDRLANDYVNPIGRFGTYFLGVLLADIVLEVRSNKPDEQAIKMVRLNEKNTVVKQVEKVEPKSTTKQLLDMRDELFLVVAVVLLTVCAASGALPISVKDSFGPLKKSLAYPLVRLVNELAWFYILYYILKKPSKITTNGDVLRFLASPIWDFIVKLNYTTVVIHFTVARYLIQSRTQLIDFSWLTLLQIISTNTVLTYCIAFVVHLVVEVPLMSIVKKISVAVGLEQTSRAKLAK